MSAAAGQSANFTALSQKFEAAGRRGGQAFNSAFKLAAGAGLAAAGGGVFAVLTQGFDRLRTLDTARFKLQALGHSADSVKTIMDSALQSVQGTAFSMGDAASAAAAAVAAGVKPGEELTKYLTSVGDAAAVAGVGFGEMASIFNKVRANGVAFTDDLQQLQDRGLPVMQLLQEQYGVSAQEFRKMVEDGKVSAADFEKALTQKLGGAAQKMGESFEGSLQNLTASTARVGANLITALLGGQASDNPLEGPTEAVQRLTEKFNELNGWITTNGPRIHEVFREVAESVQSVAGYLRDVGGFLADHPRLIQDVAVAFAAWKTLSGVTSLANNISGISSGLGGLGGKAGGAAAAINKAFATIAVPTALYEVLNLAAQEGHRQLDEEWWNNNWGTNRRATELGLRPPQPGVGDFGGPPAVGQGNAAQAPTQAPVQAEIRDRIAAGQLPGYSLGPNGTVLGPNGQPVVLPQFQRANGGIAEALGLRQTVKPSAAGIFAGVGAGTIFAEKETGGEAYIPLAASKRGRSTAILAEVAKRFGLSLFGDGGISAGTSQVASLAEQYGLALTSGRRNESGSYHGTGQAGDFSNGVRNDAMLAFATHMAKTYGSSLSELIYDDPRFSMEIKDGKIVPRSFYASAGDHTNHVHVALKDVLQPALGSESFNQLATAGGGSSNAQAAQANVTSARASVTSAQASLDQAEAALSEAQAKGESAEKLAILQTKRDAAEQKLTAAQERQTAAETKLAETTEKAADSTESGGGMDASSFGQSLFSGILQGMGLDGSVFSNPFDWPNVRSAMALANFGGGLLKGYLGQQQEGDPAAAGGGGPSLPNLTSPIGGPTTPIDPNTTVHGKGGGQPAGPLVAYNGPVTMGVDPGSFKRRQDADLNQAYRRHMPAVRPR